MKIVDLSPTVLAATAADELRFAVRSVVLDPDEQRLAVDFLTVQATGPDAESVTALVAFSGPRLDIPVVRPPLGELSNLLVTEPAWVVVDGDTEASVLAELSALLVLQQLLRGGA